MKEIITIQIGGYANFVGSHFWNFQDELLGLENDPGEDLVFSKSGTTFDVLYRVGETREGIHTYTPRLLALDLRGSLGAVKATGSLYEEPLSVETSSVVTWDGRVSKHTAEPISKNLFLQSLDDEEFQWKSQPQIQQDKIADDSENQQNVLESRTEENDLIQCLEDNVQFWTDYSKVHFHPLSLYEFEGVWHGVSPFDDFGSGKELLKGLIKEEITDRLRFFVEESDHMQGLQVIVDDSNGFAGVSADFLEMINDEYGRTPLMLFNIRSPSQFRKPRSAVSSTIRALHDAISFSELSCFSQCIIPVGLATFAKSGLSKHLQIDDTKSFHTSAVYAAAISCITLPWRMNSSGPSVGTNQIGVGSSDMANFIHALSGKTGRKVSILDLEMPVPLLPGPDRDEIFKVPSFHTLTPDVSNSDDAAASEALVIQGALMAAYPPDSRSVVQHIHLQRFEGGLLAWDSNFWYLLVRVAALLEAADQITTAFCLFLWQHLRRDRCAYYLMDIVESETKQHGARSCPSCFSSGGGLFIQTSSRFQIHTLSLSLNCYSLPFGYSITISELVWTHNWTYRGNGYKINQKDKNWIGCIFYSRGCKTTHECSYFALYREQASQSPTVLPCKGFTRRTSS